MNNQSNRIVEAQNQVRARAAQQQAQLNQTVLNASLAIYSQAVAPLVAVGEVEDSELHAIAKRSRDAALYGLEALGVVKREKKP